MLPWSFALLAMALLAGCVGVLDASPLGIGLCLLLLILAGAVLDTRHSPRT